MDGNETTAVTVANQNKAVSLPNAFQSTDAFEAGQRMAKALAASTIVPKDYQGNLSNCLVALEMANRTRESVIMVMQNLDIIHGRPTFNSKYIIARLNACGEFSPLRYEYSGEGDNRACYAYATEHATGKTLVGQTITIQMAKEEGWFSRKGSKWKTMPDNMLMYRAAKWFANMYKPEFTLGLPSSDEVLDIEAEVLPANEESAADLNEAIRQQQEGTSAVVIEEAEQEPPKAEEAEELV